jgi:hypothetical protein
VISGAYGLSTVKPLTGERPRCSAADLKSCFLKSASLLLSERGVDWKQLEDSLRTKWKTLPFDRKCIWRHEPTDEDVRDATNEVLNSIETLEEIAEHQPKEELPEEDRAQ